MIPILSSAEKCRRVALFVRIQTDGPDPLVNRSCILVGAYSPDLNPIEQVFAKLKHLMRKAAERTHEATWRRIGTLLDCFSPNECANDLRNSGYAQT
jgi:hypothetical protein